MTLPPPPRRELAPEELDALLSEDRVARERVRMQLDALSLPGVGGQLAHRRPAPAAAVMLVVVGTSAGLAGVFGTFCALVLAQLALDPSPMGAVGLVIGLATALCAVLVGASVLGIRWHLAAATRRQSRQASALHAWLQDTAFVLPRAGRHLVNLAGPRRRLDGALVRLEALGAELAELLDEARAAQEILTEAADLPVDLPLDAPREWQAELLALHRRQERLVERLRTLRDRLGPPDPPAPTLERIGGQVAAVDELAAQVAACRGRIAPGGRGATQPVPSAGVDPVRRLQLERR
ncbi:MAG: hypothetical protein H6742_19275 [Alphaproteobacteria bacterium]|nr:hypothetical protein [Alphaproteobacteria bacterium]